MEAKDLLNKKHLLIIGKTEIERRNYISELIKVMNLQTYRFPRGMKLVDEYFDFLQSEKLFEPWYESKGKYGSNQIFDFHIDWLYDNNILLIFEEFNKMEERWRLELLRIYIDEIENHKKGVKFVHLIISQEKEDGLIKKLSENIKIEANDRRSKRQIIEQNLGVIEI